METLSNRYPKAKKQHRCDFCGGIIEIGTNYLNQFNVHNGESYTWKAHSDCQLLAMETKMFEDHDHGDGLGADEFREAVRNIYAEKFVPQGFKDTATFEEELEVLINAYVYYPEIKRQIYPNLENHGEK